MFELYSEGAHWLQRQAIKVLLVVTIGGHLVNAGEGRPKDREHSRVKT